MIDLCFYSGANQLDRLASSVVIITGVGRSGKTLVGNALGTCHGVDHIDEPWFPMMLPILAGHGLIAEKLAIHMFQTSIVELSNDRILMRNANFRPADLSSIWQQKTPQEIFNRLLGLYSRDDVRRYAHDAKSSLVLTLTNTLPFWHFFRKALPACRIIHVLRDGLAVAHDVAQKRWLSDDELSRPMHALPYREYVRPSNGAKCYLPFWVETGKEERYLNLSEYARGLYYWRRLIELSEITNADQGCIQPPLVVKLQDVLNGPRETLSTLIETLGMSKTELTEQLFARIVPEAREEAAVELSGEEDRQELCAVRKAYLKLNLPTQGIDGLFTR